MAKQNNNKTFGSDQLRAKFVKRKTLAAVKLRAADHRWTQAVTDALRSKSGAECARQRAKSRMNSAASGLHRPPSSSVRTDSTQQRQAIGDDVEAAVILAVEDDIEVSQNDTWRRWHRLHGADMDGAELRVAERRKRAACPELAAGGPQKLVVLGSEVGGRWKGDVLRFVKDPLRIRVCRAPPTVRRATASGWGRRWWSILSVAV